MKSFFDPIIFEYISEIEVIEITLIAPVDAIQVLQSAVILLASGVMLSTFLTIRQPEKSFIFTAALNLGLFGMIVYLTLNLYRLGKRWRQEC